MPLDNAVFLHRGKLREFDTVENIFKKIEPLLLHSFSTLLLTSQKQNNFLHFYISYFYVI